MSFAVEQLLLSNSKLERTTAKKHEQYAIEYMIDFDIIRAYKKVYDEDGTMDDIVAHKAGSRLLRSVVVQRVMDDITCKYIAEKKLEKDHVILKLQRVYYDAMRDRDYPSALGALDKLAKHFGIYEKHQKQRRYSADELVGIRQKLEAHGVTFSEINRPLSLDEGTDKSSIGIEDAEVIERKEV